MKRTLLLKKIESIFSKQNTLEKIEVLIHRDAQKYGIRMPMTVVEKQITKSELADMTAGFYHQSLASGRWFTFSLVEQLANIGSEVHRVIRAGNDKSRFDNAVARALELFDLTLSDSRWRGRCKDVARIRECFCYAALG